MMSQQHQQLSSTSSNSNNSNSQCSSTSSTTTTVITEIHDQPQQKSENALLTLHAMMGQEGRYSSVLVDYLPSQNDDDYRDDEQRRSPVEPPAPNASNVRRNDNLANARSRAILCQWAYRVVDHFHIGRDVVAYAMNYVDRFCSHHFSSSNNNIDKNSFKLVVTSSLYLALKLHHEGERAQQSYFMNNNGRTTRREDTCENDGCMESRLTTILPYLTRGEHTQDHLNRFETMLIQTMGFHLHPPIAACFLEQYMHVLCSRFRSTSVPVVVAQGQNQEGTEDAHQVQDDLYYEANAFVDASVAEYELVTARPSLVGLASLLNAIVLLERQQDAQAQEGNSYFVPVNFASLRRFLLTKLVVSSNKSGSNSDSSNALHCCPIMKHQGDIEDVRQLQMLLWQLRFGEEGGENPAIVDVDPDIESEANSNNDMEVEGNEEDRQDTTGSTAADTVAEANDKNEEDEDMFPRLSPTSTTQLL